MPDLIPLRFNTCAETIDTGRHYDDIQAALLEQDNEGPFVIFDEGDLMHIDDRMKSLMSQLDWNAVAIINE